MISASGHLDIWTSGGLLFTSLSNNWPLILRASASYHHHSVAEVRAATRVFAPNESQEISSAELAA